MSNTLAAAIGKRIRARRDALELTGRKVARMARIDPVTLWKYETGRMVPGTVNAKRLAKVLGLSVDVLVNGAPRE